MTAGSRAVNDKSRVANDVVKEAWEPYQLPVLRFEAFALPIITERATPKAPTKIWLHHPLSLYAAPTAVAIGAYLQKGCEYTHPEGIYRCAVHGDDCGVCESHAALAKEPKRAARLQVCHAEGSMGDVRVMPLSHQALLSYVQSRGIDVGIAKIFCQEIHYVLRQKAYFAIAFANKSGGYEVRNPYYKGCVRNKDVSHICHAADRRQEHICVFEGFMDFLSYMTLCRQGNMTVCIDEKIDVLVMNSVANLKKSLECLEQYKEIHCYLDNDLAGQKTVETFKGLFGERVKNEAVRYGEYKDLNDMLRGKKR